MRIKFEKSGKEIDLTMEEFDALSVWLSEPVVINPKGDWKFPRATNQKDHPIVIDVDGGGLPYEKKPFDTSHRMATSADWMPLMFRQGGERVN